jgi:AcrR family transcriptional regulator
VPRAYTLKRRAETQADTRRRIVEAAVELHTRVGPARTTWSLLAERAGVQRHTLYAHFPDERSLLDACSGLAFERDPPPDPTPLAAIPDRDARLRAGLGALYAWFERNAELNASVLRDAEVHPIVREISEGQMRPLMTAYVEALGEGRRPKQRAMLGLALSFFSWRTLVQDSGLTSAQAAEAMATAVAGAG